jgi:hypothetical protein
MIPADRVSAAPAGRLSAVLCEDQSVQFEGGCPICIELILV